MAICGANTKIHIVSNAVYAFSTNRHIFVTSTTIHLSVRVG